MYVKISGTRSGKKFLSFVQGYRDENGKVKQKTIENIGWLDELKKEHIGQIEIYMNYIDKNLRTLTQDKTIGIIICKKNNEKFI